MGRLSTGTPFNEFWLSHLTNKRYKTTLHTFYPHKTNSNKVVSKIKIYCERESSGLQHEPQNKHGKLFIHMKILKLRRRPKKAKNPSHSAAVTSTWIYFSTCQVRLKYTFLNKYLATCPSVRSDFGLLIPTVLSKSMVPHLTEYPIWPMSPLIPIEDSSFYELYEIQVFMSPKCVI